MTTADLARVERWLREPHVSRWWLRDDTASAVVARYERRLGGSVRLLVVEESERGPIGWCQWYAYADHPGAAAALGVRGGERGIDYAIGEPTALHRGLGGQMLAALVTAIRSRHPGCGILAAPEAANVESRRLLERGGFALQEVRPVTSEPHRRPMAIYRG